MTKIIPYSDPAKNAFAKTNPFYTDNRFLNTQDPTVFGFKLLFNFDQPNSGLLWGANINTDPPENTALAYLLSIGDTQRALYLKKFLYLLHGINNQTPWFFQTLTGLKDAWAHDFSKPLLKDKKIEIECLESIDLRLTALMDYYRKACWDWKYRREVVPRNLRQFSFSVYVYEARWVNNPNVLAFADYRDAYGASAAGGGGVLAGLKNMATTFTSKAATFVSDLTGANQILNDPPNPNVNVVEGVPMSTTRNLFHFNFCEFDTMQAMHLDVISNMEPTEVKTKLVINYEDVEEENMYAWWDGNTVADSWIPSLDAAALDDVEGQKQFNLAGLIVGGAQYRKDFVKNLVEQGASLLEDKINAKIKALAMGNIYGLSLSTLGGAGGMQSLGAKLKQAGRSILNTDGHSSQAGGNVYERSTSPSLANLTGDPQQENIGDGSASLANRQKKMSEKLTNISDGSSSLSNRDLPDSPNENIFE